ncbi:hypothetical protein KIPB_000179 [Kipferlia bialata]|uniref:E3 ubiquitin protein ligase n=1 Tax=Kipferlia bialata TaxID=797122 RepID=A0A9K3CNE6_9EUKA|nr:hypothetical protein KIPB_000179 [Kipferlia bialata]|eukprot:g179.t1
MYVHEAELAAVRGLCDAKARVVGEMNERVEKVRVRLRQERLGMADLQKANLSLKTQVAEGQARLQALRQEGGAALVAALKESVQSASRMAAEANAKLQAGQADLRQTQEVNAAYSHLLQGNNAAADLVNTQHLLEKYRAYFLCPVCRNVRPKDTVLLRKCGHTMCGACAESNIKTRNRNCPSCGTRIDKADVLPISWAEAKE